MLWSVWQSRRGASPGDLLESMLATGARQEEVERFLDASLPEGGTIRDQIAADVSNALLGALGVRDRQTAADVARLRVRGWWRTYDRRPEGAGLGPGPEN